MEDSQISSDTSTSPDKQRGLSGPANSKPRRRRRWPYIIILLLVILPILGYALLPWLIPTNWLKNQIVTGIRTQFGREASISSIEISWAQGIIVRDITIERLEEFGPGNLFQASRLQLDFRPLRFALGRRLGTVRVDHPSLWIVADAAGKPNLSSLPPPPATAGFDLISITNANLYFIDRAYDREGLISIPLIRVARDSQSGQYRFLAEGERTKTTGRPAFTLQVSFVPPRQQPALQETDVIGSAELAWLDFDLSSLTVPRMGRINCQAIGGQSSGRVRLELHSDARIELYDCSAGVDDLYLRLAESVAPAESAPPPAEPTEVRIPRAQFDLRGSYEFISRELTVQDLSGLMDGLDFSTSFQGQFLEISGDFVPSALSLAAKVQPSRLREQLPFLDGLLRQGNLTVTGASNLSLYFEQDDRIDRLDFSLDALAMGLHVPNLLHKSADIPCRIAFTAEIDQATGLVTLVEPLRAELASGSFSLDMHFAQSVPMASFLDLLTRPADIAGLTHQRWPEDYLGVSLDVGRVEDFTTIFPKLAPVLSSVKLTGPVQGQLIVGPPGFQDSDETPPLADQSDDGRTALRATVSLPAEATMEVTPYFRKLSGEPLTLSFTARLAEKGYRIEELNGSCRLGDFALSLAKASLSLVARPADVQPLDSPAAVFDLIDSISSTGEFQLQNAEVLPDAVVALQSLKPAGDLSGRFDLRYTSADALSLALALDATPLACKIPKSGSDAESPVLFEKPLGITTELDLQFRVDLRKSDDLAHNSPRYSTLTALPFRARLAWKLADSLGSLQVDQKDGLSFDLRLPRLNLDTLSKHTPLLAEVLEDYQLGGIAAVGLSGKLGPDSLPEEVNLAADLTGIRCVLTDSTPESTDHRDPCILQKDPGLPLSCRASMAIGPSDNQGRRSLSIKSLALDLAASRLNLKGNLLLRSADEFEPARIFSSDYNLAESFRRLEPFVQTELSSSGRIVLDKDLFDLLPCLTEIDRKWGLEGTLDYQLDLTADPHQAMLKSVCDGGPDGLKLGPAQFKRMAQQLEMFFTTTAERPALSGTSLKLELLELDLLDQPLRMSAVMDLDEGRLIIPDLFVALGDSSAYCTAMVQNIWTSPIGYVDLYSPLIDQPSLQDLALGLISSVSPEHISADNPSAVQTPPEVELAKTEQDTGGLRLPPMDIVIRLQCDRLIFEDPASRLKFDFEQVDLDSHLTSSSLAASFTTALNGGRIGNSLTISLDEPGLPLTYRYEALELIGDENTASMVSQLFPDMTVTGTITESRTITANILHREETGTFPKEQGRTVLREGVLIGPSAPRWVIRWFPSLSLTKYYFDVADCVFNCNPEDGSVANDMVFVGKGRYNIYINGTTMADNTTKYTVGVDLSRFMTLEQRHNWRQFRVPLLTYSGQIVDHKWAKQTVSFTWPTRAAWEVLIKNNSLKTLIERRRQAD